MCNGNKVGLDGKSVEFPGEPLSSWEEFKSLVSVEFLSDKVENLTSEASAPASSVPRYLRAVLSGE